MTNNPTIDGVSREEFERSVATLYGHADLRKRNDGCYINDQIQSAWWGWKERGVLLDAPAVERQDEVAFLEMELEGERRAKLELADILGVGDEPRWKWMLSAARALQSTIARLEAQLNNAINLDFQRRERITQLESEAEFAAATYQAARDRIAEMESGRGEPVAWMCFDGEGNYDFTEDPETAEAWRKSNGDQYADWLTPLFTAPQAPVAVVLPERKDEDNDSCGNDPLCWFPQGWNACVAAAALNAPKPTEWHDVAGDDEGVS